MGWVRIDIGMMSWVWLIFMYMVKWFLGMLIGLGWISFFFWLLEYFFSICFVDFFMVIFVVVFINVYIMLEDINV